MSEHETTWKTYMACWQTASPEDKRALFQKSLAPDCVYTDPLVQVRGWDQLMAYMGQFQQQAPGSYFRTVEFAAHHGRSIARWEMLDSRNEARGDGVGYGEYDEDGKLASVSNFFPVPEG